MSINSNICDKHCVRNCIEEYHKLVFDYQFSFRELNSEIVIKYQKSPEFYYKSEPKYTFVLFLSNIGGLFGLWFGLAFIDVSVVMKTSLKYLINKFNFQTILMIFQCILNFSKILQLLRKLKYYLGKLQQINWRIILTLITIPFISHQLIQLIHNYLQFSTQIEVRIKYLNISSEDKFMNPVITKCNSIDLKPLLFEKNLIQYRNKFNEYLNYINDEYVLYLSRYGDSNKSLSKSEQLGDLERKFRNLIPNEINYTRSRNIKYAFNTETKRVLYIISKKSTRLFNLKHLLYLLFVDNEQQFDDRLKYVYNNSVFGFNTIRNELDYFEEITNDSYYDMDLTLKISSKLGQCMTYTKKIKYYYYIDKIGMISDIYNTLEDEITSNIGSHIFIKSA